MKQNIGLRFRELFNDEAFPFWIGLLSVVVLPFLSIYRVGPLSSFYLESGSLIGVLLLVLLTLISGCLKASVPRATVYFLLLAVFWAAQARIMGLTYPGLSDMTAWSFVILALGAWAVQSWVARLGLERAVSLLAFALLLGCLLQSVIGWLQYTDLAAHFKGILMYRRGIVEGQLAQRNHLGHYLMWGVLAAAWLGAQRRLPTWLSVVFVALFASVMALTGSRTVLAYVLVIMMLLPLVGIISGSLLSRTTLAFLGAVLMVLVFQLALEPLLSLFQSDVTSAVERLEHSSFGGSGRSYEWQKAWQVFLSAPWFGYGWGSYALQGFLSNVYPTGFRPYEGNVLFTHSHNSLLNLLAEMGLVGTLLVLLGLGYSVLGCLKREHNQAGLFILALLSVSFTHSLLEYPLWYIYFLSVFALMVGFAPSMRAHYPPALSAWQKWSVLALVLVLMGGIVRLGFAYHRLTNVSGSAKTMVQKSENIVELLTIAKTEPMLRYYAQLQLMNYIQADDKYMPDWANEAAGEAMRYRPFANAYKWALVAERTGQEQEARQWMQKMYQYYPTKFQAYGNAIMKEPYYFALRADYKQYCQAYFASIKQPENCVQTVLLPE